ncbi:kynurenine formamidase-like isoform X2 [Epargyreus clarus]|uniref:kynurenine formamidase-like isoform X2 n=1 Tax=Epargyreus clarus TaxID=520877 RepID=UPI003C2AFE2B
MYQPKKTEMVATEIADTKIDVEKEYQPHMWSTRFPTPEDVIQQHTDFITAESKRATESIPHELDVKYGTSEDQKLDIFGTDLPDDAAILVYFHGGYWKEMSKDVARFPAISLHRAEVKTIVIGYDHHRKVTLWDIVDQAENAISFALNYAEKMGSRGVYLAGHCAGAHLIAKVLGNFEFCDTIKGLKGVFFISGIYDLREFCDTSANTIQLEKLDAISMSPLHGSYDHLEHSEIRFYILAAEKDSTTFKKQSRDFYELLNEVCPMDNMYLEIKDRVDHYDIVECFVNKNNYLKNLILHDIRKYCKP